MERRAASQALPRAAVIVIACGSVVVLLSFGVRQTFGLFLQPMSLDLGWGREVFALAMALQNLILGAAAPLVGASADKFGVGRTIAAGGLIAASRRTM